MNPKTYKILQGIDKIEKISTFSILNNTQEDGFFDDFKKSDISAWNINVLESDGSLILEDSSLVVNANFTKKGVNEAVSAIRKIFVDISKYPIFTIRLKAPQNVFYHIRFSGINSTGDVFQVWWETSPLDDRRGTGEWEEVRIALDVFSRFAIKTENITALTEISISIDDARESDDIGEVSLIIDNYSFEKETAIVEQIEQRTSNDAFQALLVKLSNKTLVKNPWNIQRVTIFYEIEGNREFVYSVYAINKSLDNYYLSRGPFFTTTSNKISSDYYEIETYNMRENLSDVVPYTVYRYIEEGLTLVFILKDVDAISGFTRIEVKSLDIVCGVDGLKSSVEISNQYAISIFIFYIFIIGILPTIAIFIIYKLTQLKHFTFSNKNILLISIFGLSISFILSVFTGHSYDMEVWTFHARSYYESGIVTLETWPTMPFFYYILLVSYFPYTIIRLFGVNDPLFLAHPSRMLESLFIKSSLILSSLVSFFILFRIIKYKEKINRESVFLASLYFFSFISIFVSSVWGMYDCLAVALLLVGVYCGLVKEKYWLSILAFSLSGLTKSFGFIGFVPLFLKLIKKDRKRLLPFCLLIPMTLGSIFYIPVMLSQGISGFFEIVFQRFFKGSAGLSLGSDISTIVGYHGILGIDLTKLLYPYSTFFLMALVIIFYFLQSRKPESDDLIEALQFMGMGFIVFYLTGLRVFLQHYLWILPILILVSVYSRKNGLISVTILLSVAVTFLGPPSIASFGYFLFGAPYNILKVISVSDAQVVATSISFLIILSFIQIIKPSTESISTKKELREFLVMLTQFSMILALLYMQYHNIIDLSYSIVLLINGLIILLSPASLSFIRSLIKKLSVIK